MTSARVLVSKDENIDNDDLSMVNQALREASAWLHEMHKSPKKTPEGYRWILPERGCTLQGCDLPESVFRHLKSSLKIPWLFDTHQEAMLAAKLAAARTILSGWVPTNGR